MKKKIFQTLTAGALATAMVASTSVAALAAEPFWSVDFNKGYEDLQTDENFKVVENGATPKLVEDNYNGTALQVLELQPSTGESVSYSGYGGNGNAGLSENSTIQATNPFAKLGANYFREDWYDEYYDFLATEEHVAQFERGRKQPAWDNGATISYWIKSPEAGYADDYDRTVGLNSSLFTWNLEDYQYQTDDYAKYLAVHDADLEIQENEKNGVATNESGVTKDSDYYFEWKKNDDGSMYQYEDAKGNIGPVYEDPDNYGKLYFCNPRYIQGFKGKSELSYSWDEFHTEIEGYDTIPTITQSWAKAEDNGLGTYDIQPGETWELNNSQVRFARTHGSMAIDASSSIYWTNDDVFGVNRNGNRGDSWGQSAGMQNGDCFFMNSWQESGTNVDKGGSAESAKYLAKSPYSMPNEWHLVTVTLMNDWVEFYIDGQIVSHLDDEETTSVRDTYSSRGGVSLDNSKSFKRFNKGSGMRYGYGSEKTMGSIYYGNYVCRLFLDWLTDEHVTFTIGGVNLVNGNSDMYSVCKKTDKVKLAKVEAYDTVLDDDEIAALYAAGPLGKSVMYGDVDGNEKVEAADALLTLKGVVKLVTLDDTQTVAADVDGNENVEAADALLILKKVVNLIQTFPVEG